MFYTYVQNNSGGIFDYYPSEGISGFVVIEADDCEEANAIAESIGIYFDGVKTRSDCSCCGDRWYPASEFNATEVPSYYGSPITETRDIVGLVREQDLPTQGFIHYKDGSIQPVWED